jgi:hypothetical protein
LIGYYFVYRNAADLGIGMQHCIQFALFIYKELTAGSVIVNVKGVVPGNTREPMKQAMLLCA